MVKQISIINKGKIDEDELRTYAQSLRRNAFDSMITLVSAVEKLGISFEDDELAVSHFLLFSLYLVYCFFFFFFFFIYNSFKSLAAERTRTFRIRQRRHSCFWRFKSRYCCWYWKIVAKQCNSWGIWPKKWVLASRGCTVVSLC